MRVEVRMEGEDEAGGGKVEEWRTEDGRSTVEE